MSDTPQGHINAGELQSGPIAGTALVSGATFTERPLHYADVDGMAVFEGDIVLGRVADVRAVEAAGAGPHILSIGITGAGFRWPGAVVPYQIAAGMPDQQRVTDAIAHWEAHTPIRFVKRTAANADFVMFQAGSGCSSQVGRRGGQQGVTLGASCSTGNAIHEIGHTIGLWHEQSRQDRDNFVTIVWANIDPTLQFNFTQHITDGDDLGAYDFGSILHYPATAFSINGQATIIPKHPLPPGVVMGQRNALSAGDIAGVLVLYPRRIVTLKELTKDPIRDTIKELTKDPVKDTVKEIGKDPIRDTIKEVTGEATQAEGIFQPGPQVGPQQGIGAGAMPFVMAGASQFGGGGPAAAATAGATAANQVQALADALVAAEHHMAELLEAYEAAVQQAGLA